MIGLLWFGRLVGWLVWCAVGVYILGVSVGNRTGFSVGEYLVWVVQHWAVVTLVSHSVHVRVLLVCVVYVRAVVALVQDL